MTVLQWYYSRRAFSIRPFRQWLPSISQWNSLCVSINSHMEQKIQENLRSSHTSHSLFSKFNYTPCRIKRVLQERIRTVIPFLSLLLLFIITLGADQVLTGQTSPPISLSIDSHITQHGSPSPIYRQLHNFHSIPHRYLRLLTSTHQYDLLLHLSTHASVSTISGLTPRAVFAHITDCELPSCLRAIASAIAYAQVTGRVAVVFVDTPFDNSIPQLSHLARKVMLRKECILINLQNQTIDLHGVNQSIVADWAELNVRNVAAEPIGLGARYGNLMGTSVKNDTSLDFFKSISKIGVSQPVSTTDLLASSDTHVSLTISEAIWSRYAPRLIQEKIFQDVFKSSTIALSPLISNSSILGRYQKTRSNQSTLQVLHKTYNIPYFLLEGMGAIEVKLLLLKLDSKEKLGIKAPKVMFVHAQYGLGNRLRALGSAMAFAKRTERVLVLIWVPDEHLNCKFTDLFVPSDEFVVSDSIRSGEEWPFSKSWASDHKMKNVKWYNFMRAHGVQATSSDESILDDHKRHIYVSTCYVIRSAVTPLVIQTKSRYWRLLRTLTAHVDVMRLVERFSSYGLSNMIGIHIRGRTIKNDIKGVNVSHYSETSSRTTDFWRTLTNVETFIAEMRKQKIDQMFYVAADDKEVLNRLEQEFPSRVLFTARNCDDRNKECLRFALADILLLAKCSSLRGSYWSSFSEISTRIGGARFLLAGVDFGKPETKILKNKKMKKQKK